MKTSLQYRFMNPRALVMHRVAGRARRFPELDAAPLEVGDLSPRDASLARAIDHAIARRWLSLVAVLRSRLDQPWERLEPSVQAALLVGAAQLLFLERLPDHAVINEAVEWVKQRKPKAGGLINAVLRRVALLRAELDLAQPLELGRRDLLPLGDGRAWRLREMIFAREAPRRLGELTSNPDFLIAQWSAAFGWDRCVAMAMHGLVQPPIIVTGIAVDDASAASLLPHTEPEFYVFDGAGDTLSDLFAHHPTARVQDPSAAAAAELLAHLPFAPGTIIDYCAGRGTKTRQLALAFPDSRIIATDTDDERRRSLRESCERNENVTIIEPRDIRSFVGKADVLLLDVPCSNTGVLARRVEARYRFSADSLRALIDLQRQIVANSLPLLAERGAVLYSTCSLEHAENEDQAMWIARWHRMRISIATCRSPEGLPGEPTTHYSDGGYAALLIRHG